MQKSLKSTRILLIGEKGNSRRLWRSVKGCVKGSSEGILEDVL